MQHYTMLALLGMICARSVGKSEWVFAGCACVGSMCVCVQFDHSLTALSFPKCSGSFFKAEIKM